MNANIRVFLPQHSFNRCMIWGKLQKHFPEDQDGYCLDAPLQIPSGSTWKIEEALNSVTVSPRTHFRNGGY